MRGLPYKERLIENIWLFWMLLSVPFFILVFRVLVLDAPGELFFYWTGVVSIILMIVALAVTPFRRLFPAAVLGDWLLRRRRYIGVAAFSYAALHTVYIIVFWLQQGRWERFMDSFVQFADVIAWIGFAIMTAMAVTSNDISVRRLGRNWKSLQRWIYLAAPLAVLHFLLHWRFRPRLVVIYGGALALVLVLRVLVSGNRGSRSGDPV